MATLQQFQDRSSLLNIPMKNRRRVASPLMAVFHGRSIPRIGQAPMDRGGRDEYIT